MEKIGIVTESTADLPLDIIEKNKIAIVPVKLDWPDVEALPGENTFQKMREAEKRGIKSFGKTSQPSPKDYLDQYRRQLAEFKEVICVSLSSKFSGSYNSAIQARNFLKPEEQKRIFNIDSLTVSGGQGLAVLKAAELAGQGKNIGEVMEELKETVKHIQFFVILEDYKWLEASGRISRLAAVILKRMAKSGLRPLLTIRKGKLVPAGIKNNAKDFPNVLFEQLKRGIKERKFDKKIKVAIVHGDDLSGAKKLKEIAERDIKGVEIVFLNLVNDVVGIVAGPNAMAIAWMED
ncbi:MAG: DegV family protein [Candidatus Paceibacterota bacterium]|jgi:DegV family protein with EDD domain